jgi:hypothetical protein
MIKLIILALVIIVAIVFGVLSYDDDKIVFDTNKAKELVEDTKTFVKEKTDN